MSQNEDIRVIRAAKDAANKLTAAERQLRDRHTALVRERQQTWSALASRDEVQAQAARLVEDAAARWRSDYAPAAVRALSGYRELRVEGVGTAQEREREIKVRPRLPDFHGVLQAPGALTFADLCGLAPAVVTESLAAVIRTVPDERFGLPERERAARLAELDGQIGDVEARHTELVDAAADVGLVLPLLPAVQERRAEETRRAERERELTRLRAEPVRG